MLRVFQISCLLAFFVAVGNGQGQGAEPDIVTVEKAISGLKATKTKNGTFEVKCRVVERHGKGRVVVSQNSKLIEIPFASVREMDTVRDRVVKIFAARTPEVIASADQSWQIVLRAKSMGLESLARVLAYHVLCVDEGHADAHHFLGHKKSGKSWFYFNAKNEPVSRKEFESSTRGWNGAMVLESEHFKLKSMNGIRFAVDTLLDLERLYLTWHDEVGPLTDARELEWRITVVILPEQEGMPKLSSRPDAYFNPAADDGAVFTGFDRKIARGHRVFEVATEALFYSLLPIMGDGLERSRTNVKIREFNDRVAATFEIGLGSFIGRQILGPSGTATFQKAPVLTKDELALALSWVKYKTRFSIATNNEWMKIQNFIHLPAGKFYEGFESVPHRWAAARSYVAYLMDPAVKVGPSNAQRPAREALLDYVSRAFRQGGKSGSASFDKALGQKVESTEQPWIAWMEEQLLTAK